MEDVVEEDDLVSELKHLVRDTINPHGKMDTAAGPYDPVGRIWISGEKMKADREEHEWKPRDEDEGRLG